MQLQKNILFYQANFEPEVHRLVKAFDEKDEKRFQFFKQKTLKIVSEILNLSTRAVEREEWGAIRNIVSEIEFATPQIRSVLLSFGNPFSNKFVRQFAE